jgi:hypothetical protein
MALSSDKYAYFIFSKEQMDMKRALAKKRGKNLSLGSVIVNGIAKQYTDIVEDPSNTRYVDSVLVTKGYLKDIKYTKEK